ncbi:oxidoreductase [Phenylobacterium sp. Root77]|jgi:NAD(P)-dependent dehydrogenase (short-subunit alcohol dehydrogenase family)|uniref:SDR family NAD(P)-dependent oxidoreductase n=1 Tax=unclassified Phenylobacterium TaxID=2640670 RepID=UPI0006F437F1|nr:MULTISPECIES: SDR family NAD(P)-dependent oxidoreductase [unclassified Phenylobacterium]KQW70875.1 oxidoreductase [Phenylobacterium sp. Root1277]KQW90704.1 oxidoreductase [Phenylobacterium sp. Root1290]KRC39664.1 oxidoreductase [Phenylobacterium sp. Root77]
MGRLSGKSAVITGAGSGIGRAASLLFAAEGASLVIADKTDGAVETARLVSEAGGKAIALTGDAGDEAFVESLVAKAVADYGGLDVAWANAGISGGWTGFDEQDGAFWAEILRVNLIGAFLLVKHASRVMIPKEKGSIICTASVAGIRSGAGGSPYSASKAGVINLAQTSANEFYGTGVRVNAICPGLIETGMTQAIFDGARARGNEDKIGQLNPMTRGGVPIEIANAALFLASDESSYVNGQAIVVDGGLSSSHPVVRRKK